MAARDQNGAQSLPLKKRVLLTQQTQLERPNQLETGNRTTQKMTQVPVVVRSQGNTGTPIMMAAGYPLQSTSCIPMYVPLVQSNQTVQYGTATYQTNQPIVKVQAVQYGNKPVMTTAITHAIKMAPKRSNSTEQKTVTYIGNIGPRVDGPKQGIVMASPKMTTGFIRAVPPNIQRGVKLAIERQNHTDVKIENQSPVKYFLKKQESYSVLPVQTSDYSNTSLSMPESTDCFFKGSTITLEGGECKKIEDLNKDDFLKCAQVTTDKKLITSVLTEINHIKLNNQANSMVNLHFRVQVTGQNVIVEAPTNYPYFTKDGWASVDPSATERSYRLKCRKLLKGDEIFSIEKETNEDAENLPSSPAAPVTSTPQKKVPIETTFGSGGAFRPIHEKNIDFRGAATVTPNMATPVDERVEIREKLERRRVFRKRRASASEVDVEKRRSESR